MDSTSVQEFYKEVFGGAWQEMKDFLDARNNKDIGHFNVFDIAALYGASKSRPVMPYNRRTYYKISLIHGRNRVEYADKVINIPEYGVLFATPKIPYRYEPLDNQQVGYFCIFTSDFLAKSKSGIIVDDMPIFQPNGDLVYHINGDQYKEIAYIFDRMQSEIASDYAFKYDLLRNYVVALIHLGQKLKPLAPSVSSRNASVRIATLFIELLERQFPIESNTQVLQMRSARDYAERLGIHVNHLNRVLKDTTGKTTTEIIANRIAQEARILLRQSLWNVSEIAFTLGFEEVAHFSNFFKKQTRLTPVAYRG